MVPVLVSKRKAAFLQAWKLNRLIVWHCYPQKELQVRVQILVVVSEECIVAWKTYHSREGLVFDIHASANQFEPQSDK